MWIFTWTLFHRHGLKEDDIKFLNYIETWEQSSDEKCEGILKFLLFCFGLSQYLNRPKQFWKILPRNCLKTGDLFHKACE